MGYPFSLSRITGSQGMGNIMPECAVEVQKTGAFLGGKCFTFSKREKKIFNF